ncbi:hypothetical protein ACFQ36_07240 [Arthrobacter sp. GCM10027362]|uniref:hypothetical protein n=1 Tax=Arthrobacter sp. GCM10027362 TaxID=3273379 RepID=UPI00362A247F
MTVLFTRARMLQLWRSMPWGLRPAAAAPRVGTYADAAKQRFDIQILGQDVRIEANPIEYAWHYGDGSSLGALRCLLKGVDLEFSYDPHHLKRSFQTFLPGSWIGF